jgi:pyruvate ferredoxin oxidoreductase delta subunit
MGGLIVEAGSAEQYETGDWRTSRPELDKEACIDCLHCWIHCPDSSIQVKEGNMVGFDYRHCKGCGICARICPADAIEMEQE